MGKELGLRGDTQGKQEWKKQEVKGTRRSEWKYELVNSGRLLRVIPVSIQEDVTREVVTEEDYGKTWGEWAQRYYSNWQIDENALEKLGIKRSGMWKIRPQVTLWLYNSEFQSTHLKVNSFVFQNCEVISWHTFVKLEVNSEKHIWIYMLINQKY